MSTQLEAIRQKPLKQVGKVQELLINDYARQELASVAASHMSPERIMRLIANAIRSTPKLGECQPMSLLGAMMQCSALGLEPNTVLGHAYLIPFDVNRQIAGKWVKIPEVQLIIGYKGLIDLARRSGHIRSISAHIHYSDDPVWIYREGADPRLEHEPGDQEGEKLHAYAVAHFREDMGGGFAHIVLPWKQVMRIRDGSQGWQSAVKFNKTKSSPWFTHEDAMAKKTAIRALAKYLPLSVEFRDALAVDHDSGARADFTAFAMNPMDGVMTIEGEASTPDEEPAAAAEDTTTDVDRKAAAKRPAAAKKRGEGKDGGNARQDPAAQRAPDEAQATAGGAKVQGSSGAAVAEAQADDGAAEDDGAADDAGGPFDPDTLPDHHRSLFEQIAGALAESAQPGHVEAVLEMFSDPMATGPLDQLRSEFPAAGAEVDRLADEARERTAG